MLMARFSAKGLLKIDRHHAESEPWNFPKCYPIAFLYIAFLHARLNK